ncbi:pilus assembly protein [Halomonas sp. WWR20]
MSSDGLLTRHEYKPSVYRAPVFLNARGEIGLGNRLICALMTALLMQACVVPQVHAMSGFPWSGNGDNGNTHTGDESEDGTTDNNENNGDSVSDSDSGGATNDGDSGGAAGDGDGTANDQDDSGTVSGGGGSSGTSDEWVETYPDIPYQTPANAQADVNPRSMVVMSNDHQLFFKAYTDWSDIDGDGDIDDSFNEDVRYYGYFDNQACYSYDESLTEGAFKHASEADNDGTCSGQWSGNFLNWLSMTRMDIVRKVLYGGKRYRDDTDHSTILERAYLPYDAHSFVKVVNDSSVLSHFTPFGSASAVSFCNTTGYNRTSGESKDVDAPPLIRVATGEWPNWAANERWQCTWRNESGRSAGYASKRPEKNSAGLGQKEYVARVEVCAHDEENCKSYPGSNESKPTGLLHEYADSIDFGLVSGSYENNLSGGVLRANIRSFNEEINANTGVFDSKVTGIVSNLDAFRISRYRYSDGTYDNDGCPWGKKLSDIENGECSSWGNPFAEMVEETLNYLTGGERTSAFSVGAGSVESEYVTGLTSPEWENDTDSTWCAAQTMILMNSSEVSFDSDQLSNIDLLGDGSVTDWTNKIVNEKGEKIAGKYFIGEAGGDNNKLCTAKTIDNLGEAKGICPGAPGLEGSYNVAGLAKYAHDKEIVRNKDDSDGRKVSTYAVRLSANTPIIDLGKVKIVPACENVTDNGKCAIVDFRQKSISDKSGEFEITWEVAEFGGDYDSDIEMNFSYDLNDNDNRLTITTEVTDDSSSRKTGVGYILSGTWGRYELNNPNQIIDESSDGFTAHSGIDGYNRSLCGSGCYAEDGATERSYKVLASSGASALEPPLYYAAINGNDKGLEAYFEVNNIGDLANSLQKVLDEVLSTNNQTGAGLGYSANIDNLVFQTVYNNLNSWSGDLIAYTLDSGMKSRAWGGKSARELLEKNIGARQIITFDVTTGQGVPFNTSSLSDTGDDTLSGLAAYLRGDSSNEQSEGGTYRDRLWLDGKHAVLGDIIDSRPFVIGKPDSYYVPENATDGSYANFVAEHAGRPAIVYVGANDGMLHGFEVSSGREAIAYVPGMLLGSLSELADPAYKHRYYVDGSPTVLDARWGSKDGWHSVLASGLGAGGRGIFALDVTDPKAFNENNAANIALFEYGPRVDQALFGSDNAELHLGYVYGQPSIVQLENGRFAVVFGNGYFSPSGKAALYIVFLYGAADGVLGAGDVLRLVPDDVANTGENGLSTVSLVDRDGNGRMDAAYGGDLQGNLWRFDLGAEQPDAWTAGVSLLFKATQNGVNQAITAAVDVGRHSDGGLMVFLGTGSRPGRSLPTSQSRGAVDSVYAIRDTWNADQNLPLDREDLAARSLYSAQTQGVSGSTVSVRYFDSATGEAASGWYFDFPDGNERMVETPTLSGKRLILTSLIPGYGMCGAEDSGYLYELSAFTGTALSSAGFDINGDGDVDDGDVMPGGIVPAGIATQGALFSPVINTDLDADSEDLVSVSTSAQKQSYDGKPVNPLKLGRVSWRELEH